jgi:hypothetical protein
MCIFLCCIKEIHMEKNRFLTNKTADHFSAARNHFGFLIYFYFLMIFFCNIILFLFNSLFSFIINTIFFCNFIVQLLANKKIRYTIISNGLLQKGLRALKILWFSWKFLVCNLIIWLLVGIQIYWERFHEHTELYEFLTWGTHETWKTISNNYLGVITSPFSNCIINGWLPNRSWIEPNKDSDQGNSISIIAKEMGKLKNRETNFTVDQIPISPQLAPQSLHCPSQKEE